MALSRRQFLTSAAAGAVLGSPAAEKPAVTLVIAGRCRASSVAAMPNFSRLRRESVSFTRAYTVCPEPARCVTAILASRYPHVPGAAASILERAGIGFEVIDLTRPAADDYSAGLAALDATMGALGREHSADPNRMLVVTATRGAMLGMHNATSDDTWFEEAVRVPLIVRWPGVMKPRELDVLTNSIDIVPTIAGLCGTAIPGDVQGRNLAPLLRQQQGDRPESVYGEGAFGSPWEWRMLLRGLDKAVFDVNGSLAHLYNLGEDPAEAVDLAGDQAHERRADELTALFEATRRRTQDHVDPSGLRLR